MREEVLTRLQEISRPKLFAKNDYICYEGQPGSEMYIILKGSVGVFLTSVIGTLSHVATIGTGDFFGEMAIFDNLPRSASCIALEDTIAVAINKENLPAFLENCPEITGQILENMSSRIRKLNEELYKNNRFVKNRHVPKFVIPGVYRNGHVVKAPYQAEQYITSYKQACPICGRAVNVKELKRNILQEKDFDAECRITYIGCDPLWMEVISCEYCHYTNHYLKFFSINNFEFEEIKKVLESEHRPVVESRIEKRSDFDVLVIKYLQAININEHVNPGANALIGSLWRNLYWLSKDIGDENFAKYCRIRAIEKYHVAVDENQLHDSISKGATALSLASLLIKNGTEKEVPKYLAIAAECPDERVSSIAKELKLIY